MIPRAIESVIRARLAAYPAVALDGPRQSGKTTLARTLGGQYFDLEQEGDRVRLDVQWDSLRTGTDLVILDEAQCWPGIFPRLRGAIDADRQRAGRFLLLGSVAPALKSQVSESLAGRLALVELTPLTASEIPAIPPGELWLRGGYPEGGAVHPDRYPRWQQDHLALVAHRDLPNWGLPARPAVTDRLLRMVAAVHGQLWNASQLGQALGLSHPTVNSYLDYLEGAFLVRVLRPFAANLRKRLTRSPRVYWRDSGLLHALLRVEDHDHLLQQPWVGASWEGFVIGQILATLQQVDRPADAFFFRTADGHELDLLLDLGRERWAVEIKLTSAPSHHDLERLRRAADLVQATHRVLVSQVADPVSAGDDLSCNLPALLAHLRRRFAPS